jgi:hypothetical protein
VWPEREKNAGKGSLKRWSTAYHMARVMTSGMVKTKEIGGQSAAKS